MLQPSTKLHSAITHITTIKTGEADIQLLYSGKFLQKLHIAKNVHFYSSQSDKLYHLYGLTFNPFFVFYKVSCTLFLFHKTWIRHIRNESMGILYAVQFTCVAYSKYSKILWLLHYLHWLNDMWNTVHEMKLTFMQNKVDIYT